MTEENPEKEVKKEDRPSFLKEAKSEREALEKVRDEIKTEIENLKALREEDILSGRAPQPKDIKKEYTDKEYAEAAKRGEILK